MHKAKLLLLVISAMSTLTWPQVTHGLDSLSYDTSPETLVFSYHVRPGELMEQDSTPRIRIYGDGKAFIHYSKVYKKAGDYTVSLKKHEMQEIMQLISKNGLLGFEAKEVIRAKQAADISRSAKQKALKQPQTATITMDQDIIQVYYNLQAISPSSGATKHKSPQANRITYSGLKGDTRKYPDILSIQGLARVDSWFKDLSKRTDLHKIDTPKK